MNILPVPSVVVWAVSVCYISCFRARSRPPEGGFPDARRINPAFLPRIIFPTFRRRGSPSPVPGKKIQCEKPPRGFSLSRRRQSRGKERPAASAPRRRGRLCPPEAPRIVYIIKGVVLPSSPSLLANLNSVAVPGGRAFRHNSPLHPFCYMLI